MSYEVMSHLPYVARRGATIGEEHRSELPAGWYYRLTPPGTIPSEFDWDGPHATRDKADAEALRHLSDLDKFYGPYCG